MFIKSKQLKDFTLIEILVVISIVSALASIMMLGFQNYASYQQYNQAVGDVKFVLNQSRVNARSAVDDKSHGVKFFSNSITQYIGNPYSLSNPTNRVINYSLVTIQANLKGGVDQILFNKLTGIPSATGTIVVSGTKFLASTTIKITDTGVIQ